MENQTRAKKENKKREFTFFSDFKKFITRGNVLNLAVAVIIGAAFGKIVTSLVNDIIMPLVSLALGGVNFADLKWVIRAANETQGITETALGYGAFIQAMIDFLIIAFCIFLLIRLVSAANRKVQDLQEHTKNKSVQGELVPTTEPVSQAEPPKPSQEELLTQIRDLLKSQNEKAQSDKSDN